MNAIRLLTAAVLLGFAGLTSIAIAQEPAAAADSASSDLEPIKIDLPRPMFVGTPADIKSDNLEPVTGQQRPPFLAPKGVTNVAAGKEVVSSDKAPILGDMEQITDGDKEGSDGSFVELGPGVQWVQIDLGAQTEIFAIVVWHYHAQARVYKDVIVKVSDDPDAIKNVTTVFNNDHDNSSKLGIGKDKEYIETNEGKLFDAKGAKGRYVRLYSNGNTSNEFNDYIEVEVYGRPAK
ncbi:MAG TPA: discoidin domain-containing protein [Candidatus Hydrogenedentes bacterium]|nr:discoidin domain-containing protein [Candidatus Hydrogenedentota bacterium]